MTKPREPHWSDIVRSTDFYRDILVTILGVLIALGIGEWAQSLDWKSKAAEASDAIDAELANNAATFEERILLQPCLASRIDDLEAVLADARRTGRIDPVGTYGATPYRGLATAAWEDALNSGALAHLPPLQREGLASVYPTIASYNQFVMEEQQLWWRMRLLADSAGPADSALLTELGSTLKQLAYRARINGMFAGQLQRFVTLRGLEPNLKPIFGEDATRETLAQAVKQRTICKPLVRGAEAVAAAAKEGG